MTPGNASYVHEHFVYFGDVTAAYSKVDTCRYYINIGIHVVYYIICRYYII